MMADAQHFELADHVPRLHPSPTRAAASADSGETGFGRLTNFQQLHFSATVRVFEFEPDPWCSRLLRSGHSAEIRVPIATSEIAKPSRCISRARRGHE